LRAATSSASAVSRVMEAVEWVEGTDRWFIDISWCELLVWMAMTGRV
jgi:hypothetical protein